jgi:hypothetical protein
MKRISILVITACLALGQQQPSPNLVLISIDGLMPSTVRDAEKLGAQIPNLREFRDKGAFGQGLRGVFPTVTYPSHTTMITGHEPAEHGIVANTLFDPEQRMNGAWFWYAEQIQTPTLWDVAKSAGLSTAAVSWPVTVGAKIDFNFPEYRETRTADDAMLYRQLSTPGLQREYEASSGYVNPNGEFDEGRAKAAAFLIRTRKPRLLLLHIFDLDSAQHTYGPGSPESLRALEKLDGYIGMLRQEVAAAGLTQSTRWIVTSDHGFNRVDKAFHPHAFLASLGLGAEEGKPESWRVAAHANGGSIAFIARDPKDAEAQRMVVQKLDQLKKEGGWGIDEVFDRSELDRMQAYSAAFAAVTLASNFTNGGNRTGRWVTSSGNTKGTHGFAPGPVALDCTFIAFGPGISARVIPRADLKDIAKTAAALLNLDMPSAEGRNLLAQ